MIFEKLILLLTNSIILIFGIIPDLPGFPSNLSNSINNFLDLFFSNLGLLNFFIPLSTIKIAIPLIIVIVNFDRIYHFVRWVIRKIPFANID